LPKSQIQNANKLKKLETKLEKELGRRPSEEEIAEQTTSLSPRQVQLIKFFTRKSEVISLSALVSEESELCWGDCLELPDALSPLEAICQRELYRRLNESLLILTERERLVLVMVFGLNQEKSYTLAEIGKSLGISRERARQIKEKALEKLKKYLDPSSWQEA
jgi:RNA polymerase nonessential primary-like sigma factor